jgi:hypothetical protein
MQTVQFLQSHSLELLREKYAVSARRHTAHPNLVLLKYSQIESPMAEPIVQECRGLILDEAENWRVVCRAYDKFFNYGEPNAVAIDWSTARVYEKLDGSLMTLYRYRGQWHVSSSGTPDAAGPLHNHGGSTFAKLFWETWSQLGYSMPDDGDDRVFMFELMTPLNRIVVSHGQPRIVLHGVRSMSSGLEIDPEPVATEHGWECVRSFPLQCIDDCVKAADELNPLACEGYVVRDAAFRRVKVKSPQYVALAHIKDSMNGRRILEIVRTGECDEVLSHFPEMRVGFEEVQLQFDQLCAQVEADYLRLKDIPAQKDFAGEALKTRASAPLFSMRAGRCASAREYFATCLLPPLERLLDLSAVTTPAQPE